METLTTTTKVLEEALEALHRQSNEWLNSLAFVNEENRFFDELLSNRLLEKATAYDRQLIRDMLKGPGAEETTLLINEISLHERKLFTALSNRSVEWDYRHAHRAFAERMERLEERHRLLKRTLYDLVRNSNITSNTNETLTVINDRRAVRKYKDVMPNRLRIEQLLHAAAMAPSAMNKQPWKFYVLSSREKIKQYSEEILKVAANVFHFTIKDVTHEEDPIFHGAPVVVFITAPEKNEWAGLDVGMCAENLMLAAKSVGLDTCPVGLAKFIDQTTVYNELGIPSNEKVMLAVVLGIGDEKPIPHERKPNQIVFLS